MLPGDPSDVVTPSKRRDSNDSYDDDDDGAVHRVALAVVPEADGDKDDHSLAHATFARLMEKKKFVLEKETQLQRWSVALDREGARQRRVAESMEAEMSAAGPPPPRRRFVWPSPNDWRRRTTRQHRPRDGKEASRAARRRAPDARQREIDIKQDLCDDSRRRSKAAEAASMR